MKKATKYLLAYTTGLLTMFIVLSSIGSVLSGTQVDLKVNDPGEVIHMTVDCDKEESDQRSRKREKLNPFLIFNPTYL